MSSVIFSGNFVKALKKGLNLFNEATIWSDSIDPSATGFAAPQGDAFFSTLTNIPYIKQGPLDTDWSAISTVGGSWKTPVADASALPATLNTAGDVRIALDTGIAWEWNGTSWQLLNLVQASAIGNIPNANGFSVDATTNTVTLQPADNNNPGIVTDGAQTIGGDKTLTGNTTLTQNLSAPGIFSPFNQAIDLTTGRLVDSNGATQLNFDATGVALPELTASFPLHLDSSKLITAGAINLANTDVTGILPITHGGTGSATQNFVDLTTNQTVAGIKTLTSQLNADGGIDLSASGTLTIGATNSTTINIGNSGATVNIQGTTIYENTPQLLTADPLITVNHGGGAGSGQNSGIQIEEAASITGYVETSSDRNSWTLKAPNTAGVAVITPGVSGITLDQSSHDPVTLGTANGLSLATQILSLDLSSTSTTGALSPTDWNTFNGKQTALTFGNLTDTGTDGLTITGGTGAVIGTGTNVSQHVADATHNGYLASTDWSTFNAKQPAGNYITALTGAVTASGPGSATATLDDTFVTAALLTGYAVGANTPVIATDTILGAFGKIQSQLNAIEPSGDIENTSFSASASQTDQPVTGLAFANATVHGFSADLTIATSASLFEKVTLNGVQRTSDWQMSVESSGDISGYTFTINASGQVLYSSPPATATLRFRARTL